MIVHCTKCNKKYKLSPERFGDRDSLRVRCAVCSEIITVRKDPAAKVTGSPADTQKLKDVAARIRDIKQFRPEAQKLPENYKVSLAVIRGELSGQIFPFTKPAMIIGRSGADVQLEDSEVSRMHAAVEAYGDRFILRDLDSTNGTFFDGKRVKLTEIKNQAEFDVGGTGLMLIVRPEEPTE